MCKQVHLLAATHKITESRVHNEKRDCLRDPFDDTDGHQGSHNCESTLLGEVWSSLSVGNITFMISF